MEVLGLILLAALGYALYLKNQVDSAKAARNEAAAKINAELKTYNDQITNSLNAVKTKKESLRELESELPDPTDPSITGKR